MCRLSISNTSLNGDLPRINHSFFAGFTFTYLQNDIALLDLDHEVEFSRSVRPACLPFPFRDVPDFTKLRTDPTIVGWGAAAFGGGTVSAQKEVTFFGLFS